MVRTVRAARCYHAADWQLSRLSNSWGKNVERHGTENIFRNVRKAVRNILRMESALTPQIQCGTYLSTMTQEEQEINGLGGRLEESLRSSQSTTSSPGVQRFARYRTARPPSSK